MAKFTRDTLKSMDCSQFLKFVINLTNAQVIYHFDIISQQLKDLIPGAGNSFKMQSLTSAARLTLGRDLISVREMIESEDSRTKMNGVKALKEELLPAYRAKHLEMLREQIRMM